MKTVDLAQRELAVAELLQMAEAEPIVVVTTEGREFVVSEADDFDREVEALRASSPFQRFLDERAASSRRRSLDEFEREIEAKRV